MPHMAFGHCPTAHAAQTRPDAVAAKEWADRVPWDVPDAIQAWKTGRSWWAHLEAGGHLGRLPPRDKKGTGSRRAQGDNLRLPGWRANGDPH